MLCRHLRRVAVRARWAPPSVRLRAPMPSDPLDDVRMILLQGTVNFRDLGGYETADGRRVRMGRLFRADGLQHLTGADVEELRDRRGLRAVVDLRSTREVEIDGLGPLPREPVRYHHLPLFDGERSDEERPSSDLSELYYLMLRFAREPIGRVVECLVAADAPAVFHCAAGKDRTGVVSAVILGALGVPDPVIVDDYAYTKRNLDKIVARLRASEAYQYVFEELPEETLHAEPETMERLLARVRDEWGGMRGYLEAAGLEGAMLSAMRELLLEA